MIRIKQKKDYSLKNNYTDYTKIQKKITCLREEIEEDKAENLGQIMGIPYLNLATTPINREAVTLFNEEETLKYQMAPIALKNNLLTLAVKNPSSPLIDEKINQLKKKGYKTVLVIVSSKSINRLLKIQRKNVKIINPPKEIKLTKEQIVQSDKLLKHLDSLSTRISTFKTTELLSFTMASALNTRASDIHFEPKAKELLLRFRIDGVLNEMATFPLEIYKDFLSRVKILSNLKLNLTESAQDGRLTISIDNKKTDVRVSILPSNYGESIVMRILRQDSINLSLNKLGISKYSLDILNIEMKKTNGIILNTGPTGSGKTTTLYAIMKEIATEDTKIITVEDPIEYKLDKITQTQVNKEENYTFATGLRAILRQDPDKILVGEIRDLETSEMAVQAASTGHLVLSTLHTNDSAGAVPRLLDLGVNSNSLAPVLNAAIAQRLVRILCPYCKKKVPLSKEMIKKIEVYLNKITDKFDKNSFLKDSLLKEGITYVPTGCPKCNNIGFKGRIAIFEILVFNDNLKKMITGMSTSTEIKKEGIRNGLLTMAQDGILKVLKGVTSFEEVARVADLSFFGDLLNQNKLN